MAIDLTLVDKLLADYKKPEDLIGENGLLKQLTKAVLERAMQAELTEHLGYVKHDPAGYQSGNSRNGVTKKTLKALGAPQKLTTSARIDLTRSQTDHAAWHADGRDLPHPCRRRVYR